MWVCVYVYPLHESTDSRHQVTFPPPVAPRMQCCRLSLLRQAWLGWRCWRCRVSVCAFAVNKKTNKIRKGHCTESSLCTYRGFREDAREVVWSYSMHINKNIRIYSHIHFTLMSFAILGYHQLYCVKALCTIIIEYTWLLNTLGKKCHINMSLLLSCVSYL